MKVLVAQLCLTLCNPMDCSLPGSSVYGISQARILEWVAIPFSRGSSWPMDWTRFSCFGWLPLSHLRSPPTMYMYSFFKIFSIYRLLRDIRLVPCAEHSRCVVQMCCSSVLCLVVYTCYFPHTFLSSTIFQFCKEFWGLHGTDCILYCNLQFVS